MDQGRLDELRKLLQKRHQEPKQGLERNFNGENFKVSNSEIQNYEVSNSEASNSETLNSDPGALNLKAKLEAEADQNSACENSAEPQNFISDDGGALPQNSKARDYDKDPIIIKKLDDLFWLIALGILLICSLTYHFSDEHKFRFYMKILLGYGTAFFFIYAASFINSKKTITFMKDKIEFKNKTKCEKEMALKNISVYRYAYMIPNFAPFDVKIKFCVLVLFIMIVVALYNFKFYMFIFIIMGLLLMPIIKFLYYILFEKTARFLLCDKLLICNGFDSELFTINNKKELSELQKYFLDTLNIDIAEGYLFWKPPYDIAKIIVNKMNKFMKF
nr:hypothetical protein [uncultured Campylobacter sp.]